MGRTVRKVAKLKSMKVSDGFRAFVVDQLAGVPQVLSRAMFGGVGLYSRDVFFGLLARDLLYLKTDDSNRGDYEAAGMPAFRPYADKAMTMPYYEVPVAVLENPPELAAWAKRSIAVAKRTAAARRAAVRRTQKGP